MSTNFENDVYEWGRRLIEKVGYKANKDSFVTLANVFTLSRMFISTIPRRVHVSESFMTPQKYDKAIKQIIHDLNVGHNVNARLSRRIKDKKVYTDRMLADWGIHHLHLGEEVISKGKNEGLIEGNKEILFVWVTNNDAYLIGIFDHDSWTKTQVLEIVHDNWYHLLKPFELPRDVRSTIDITDLDRLELRNACVNTAVLVRGCSYMGLGGGLTCGNIGGNDVHKANTILRASDDLAEWVKNNYSILESYMSGAGIDFASETLEFDVSKFVISAMYTIKCKPSNYRIHIQSQHEPYTLVPHGFEAVIEPCAEKREIQDHRAIKGLLIECG
ncbi:hypothetical protein VIOR3934_21431 [Vibrio orientalis CIP 102891 = ATCC 33934]|uniref:Uncharacterized protein n=1 Tax=Vibrio orientalis CIP 102891 = ATCC 33934 TaxID=675816 RepID=C9QK92_VIBOR|nr:hypothetical protein [Vibrio orientalis]EEX92087.1 hypothetical protein VIA_002731 [Vibrio orientalis CIP 102891 = ATCC 33934]EGU46086.1 hypothetical protein VIOR3934_21431 [Vibrio orientalis CIP 102891 = ATCC 33934]